MNEKFFGKVVAQLFRSVVESVKDHAFPVMQSVKRKSPRHRNKRLIANCFRPYLEALEARIVPSFADGNGAVVTNLTVINSGTQLLITFDGPLNATPTNPLQSPTNTANYSVQVPAANPEMVTSSTSSVSITSASYNSANHQVTLNLGSALTQGTFYRVFINGTASVDATAQPGLVDADGNAIDGDYDDTASGNFYGLCAWTTAGTPLLFSDSGGDQITLAISGPGQLEAWRALDGDFDATNLAVQSALTVGAIQQLSVPNGVLGETTLTGSASFATGNSVVVIPPLAGQGITYTSNLAPYFQLTPPPLPTPPTPVVATPTNLPYALEIQQVTSTLPAVQSAVSAQDNVVNSPFNGYWLLFGGRNNGLHNFDPTDDFPPQEQNEDIYVINPATWQTWTIAWSATDISGATAAPLYSTNQQSFQQGDNLFVVGGYGAPDEASGNFGTYTTYDTLTALSVDGLITAVVSGGNVAVLSRMQQIQDPRLQVTGGEMQMLGNQAVLALGQDFQGEYFSPTATQTYTDEIQSFQISYNGQVSDSLGISNYQAQNDQVNFRRRDYDLGNIIQSDLQPGLEVYGGVFTPGAPTDPNGGEGYRTPIVVSGVGATQVGQYQQFFNQYSAPEVGLFDANTQSMYTVFFGGISLYDYNFSTGQLTADSELPFVDDVTTLQQSANGVSQEFEMPSQLPGLYGAEANFFATPGLPEFANGVIQLNDLSQPTTLGYMYGGILSTVPNTTDPANQTAATNALFRIELVPLPTTYTVTSLADSDTGSGNSGTLRYVLNLANADHTGTASQPDRIQFATGAGTIAVGALSDGAPLPALASDEVAIIDATTATGYTGSPIITLNGTLATAVANANGLTISGGSSTIKGLDIFDFSGNGIQLDTNGGDTVLSSYIGITTTGTIAANGDNGIDVVGTADNIIGSSTPVGSASGLGGNVISGNEGNGVLLEQGANNNTVAGNYVGTDPTGTIALGNRGDGVQLNDADNNTIGNDNPVSGVTYATTGSITSNPVSVWQGIRNGNVAGTYMITGTSGANGLLFDGTIAGVGTTYLVDYPGAATTSVYGPDNQVGLNIALVGSYKNADASTAAVKVNGFVYEGTTAGLTQSGNYQTVDESGAEFNYVHSTMQGLAVGNYDSAPDHGMGGLPLGPGQAFIYDIAENTFLTNIVYPGSLSDTAYGIWYNGNGSYTICGGWSPNLINNLANQNQPIGQAFLVDYNVITGTFSNWASFSYPFGTNYVTHFEGISSVEKGIYTLSADSVQSGSSNPTQGSWVTVVRNPDGSFGTAQWVNLNYTGVDPTTNITSSNSVYGNEVVGQVIGTSTFPFQATVNVSLQLSNVISGNGGNGIQITGANDNQIAMNYVGTDVTGTVDLGNAGNGVLVTDAATGNMIGGEATGGDDPTGSVFVVPPQGNLISGNDNDGVLINDLATANQLSGNFIGTNISGNIALGNAQDGVAINDADGNELIGCTLQEDPFVFYNVIDGNGGNGLRVTNSSNATIQANFFGLGADNITPVGNALDGVLINGNSANMQFGGVIPLGNVVAANDRNGVEIAGSASGGVYFNTFCGVPAFIATAVGNALDGFLVTSTGGSNLIRTTIISGNGGNGIHISGNATGVQVTDAIIGMNSNGLLPIPNGGNGVLIDGNAHDNAVGGFQPSVAPQNTISDNGGNGVAVVGNASDNIIFNSFIGADVFGNLAAGNAGAGIFIGGNAQGTIIGGTNPSDLNLISGNLGGGIQLTGPSQDATVFGNLIGTDSTGLKPIGNHGNGITIVSSNNTIGGTLAGQGNVIAFNTQNGVVVDAGTSDGIRGNSIFGNGSPAILLVANGNLNQPAPVLTAASVPEPNSIQITGTLTAAANATYFVDMFVSLGTTPGQGQTFLGFLSVTTGATGIGSIVFDAALPANVGNLFTATATSPTSNTSALSGPLTLGASANVYVSPFSQPVIVALPTTDASANSLTYISAQVSAYDALFIIEQQYDLMETPGITDYYYNTRGAQEKYLVSGNGSNAAGGGYYFVLPNGNLYAWDGNSLTTSESTGFVTELGTTAYSVPTFLTNAPGPYDPLAFTLEQSLDLQAPPGPDYFYNARNAQEKYLISGNGSNPAGGSYYVVMPNGNLYAWDGNSLSTTLADGPIAQPGMAVYSYPPNLTDAPAPYNATAFATEQTYDLQAPSGADYFYNARGAQEKYLISGNGSNVAGGGYYLLMPNGNLYAWDGNSLTTTLGASPVVALEALYYQSPAMLTVPTPQAPAAVTASIVGNTLTVSDPGGFVGTVLVFVAADDSIAGSSIPTSQVYQVTFTDNLALTISDTTNGTAATTVPNTMPATAMLALSSGATVSSVQIGGYSQLFALEQQYDLMTPSGTTDYFLNARGDNEKYLMSGNGSNPAGGNYYFLLPNGNANSYLYAYVPDSNNDLTASTEAGSLATLSAAVYADPTLLTNAGPAYTPVAYNAQQSLDLIAPPSTSTYYYDARDAQEKYLVSGNGSNAAGGGYYVLMPNGNLYAWTNNDLAATLTTAPVATLPTAYYQNPSFLIDPAPPGVLQVSAQSSNSVTTTAVTATITGATLTVNDTDGYIGAVLIYVTVTDGAMNTMTATYQVTFT